MNSKSLEKKFRDISLSIYRIGADYQVLMLILILYKRGILKKYISGNNNYFQGFVFECIKKFSDKERDLLYEAAKMFENDLDKFTHNHLCSIQKTLDGAELEFESMFNKFLFMLHESMGRKSGQFVQPKELSELMIKIVNPKPGETIFNPFAGMASFCVHAPKQIEYYGQEKFKRTHILGCLRLIAHERFNDTQYDLADSFIEWPEKRFNYILFNAPFNMRISKNSYPELDTSFVEKIYVNKSIESLSTDGKAVIVFPQAFMSIGGKRYVNLRRRLIEENYVESIISFPGDIFQHMNVSISLLVLKKSRGKNDRVKFLDALDLLHESDARSKKRIDVQKILNTYHSGVEDKNYRFVQGSEFKKNDFNLNVNYYLTPLHFPEKAKRTDSEKLLKLDDVVNVIRPKRENVTDDHPFVNMTELSDEPSNYVLDFKSLPKKKKYSNNQPLLNENALLVGKVGGVLKPTLFLNKTNPIFLGSNVYSLRVNTNKIDPEYLIFELNTEFVRNQVRRYTKGATIPHINKSDLLNIVIRVPEKQEQARLFNEWITGIARNKIESLNIEKEKLFSDEFDLIHDMHHTLKNELSILKGAFRDIKGYMVQKSKSKKFIDLTEPIREIKEGADPSLYDTVEGKINATERSLHQMSSFVRDYKTILKFDPKNQNAQWINLKDYLLNLCSEYKGFDYTVEEETSVEPVGSDIESYQLHIDKALFRMIFTNVIENARNHGFSDYEGEKIIEILIRDNFDTTSYTDIKDSLGNVIDQVDVSDNWIEVVVRNTGDIIEDDLDPKKVFERGVGKGGGYNRGIGLTHVQKAMKSLKGVVEIVRPIDSIFSFEIRLKFPLWIGKSPNWDKMDTITRDE